MGYALHVDKSLPNWEGHVHDYFAVPVPFRGIHTPRACQPLQPNGIHYERGCVSISISIMSSVNNSNFPLSALILHNSTYSFTLFAIRSIMPTVAYNGQAEEGGVYHQIARPLGR